MARLHAVATDAEWASGRLESSKVADVVNLFRAGGFATVGNVIPHAVLDSLRPRMDYDAAQQAVVAKYEERGPASGAGGHLQMGVPRMTPWVAKEIVTNPILEQLAAALLLGAGTAAAAASPGSGDGGGEVFLAFFNGNTNIPGSGKQLLHTDGGWDVQSPEQAAAAGESWPQPTASLVFNFSTDAIGPENGPTQLWPGD